jgi:hypothetical protein
MKTLEWFFTSVNTNMSYKITFAPETSLTNVACMLSLFSKNQATVIVYSHLSSFLAMENISVPIEVASIHKLGIAKLTLMRFQSQMYTTHVVAQLVRLLVYFTTPPTFMKTLVGDSRTRLLPPPLSRHIQLVSWGRFMGNIICLQIEAPPANVTGMHFPFLLPCPSIPNHITRMDLHVTLQRL